VRGLALALFWAAIGCGGAAPLPDPPRVEPTGKAPTTADAPPAPTTPEAPPDAARGDRLPLLGDRLRLRAPEGAKIAPRGRSIMAADASNDEETRVILVPGAGEMAKFVLLARESFLYGTGDVPRDAKALLGKDGLDLRIESVKVGAGLSAVALVPKRDLDSHGALFVLGAVIEREDKTLCELSFYILSDMVSERPEWTTRAREILATVEPGNGKLPGATKHRLDTGSGHVLTLVLPRQSVLTRQEGPDFTVYRLRELGKIGDSMPTIGVYVGGHPSHQFKQAGISDKRVKKQSGKLLGKATDWYTWTSENGDQISEAMATAGKRDRVHVFVTGPQKKHAELRRALEAMSLSTQ
jgi:hypothetical protein